MNKKDVILFSISLSNVFYKIEKLHRKYPLIFCRLFDEGKDIFSAKKKKGSSIS
jgi:hypothetical protein